MATRANEDAFAELHQLVTTELINRVKTGEATTADLKAATDWLYKNNITGAPVDGSPLAALAGIIPELTFDDVQRHI